MRLERYTIVEPGVEEIVFRKEHIDESGKMECRYALWRNRETDRIYFGLMNETMTQAAGIILFSYLSLIKAHLQRLIKEGAVTVRYRYIPAPPEEILPDGVVEEFIISPITELILLPEAVRSELRKMLEIIEKVSLGKVI